MVRPDDIKLNPETPFLTDPAARVLIDAFEARGREIFFVGGCVRNAVMGLGQTDLDLSTSVRPEDVVALAEAAGIKALPTGIDHGTVTCVVQGVPLEVTTFRRDVATDGRRAVVAFSDNIEEDARRRDFTMNALYARPDGTLIDPVNGFADAQEGRVIFIDDAGQRIREDYLRILRFFRFSAFYSNATNGFDAETLAAITAHLDGLESLSRERVGAEIQKLLIADDPAWVVATMDRIGVLGRILPCATTEVLTRLIAAEDATETSPNPIRRLASLGPDDAPGRLRMSKSDSRDLEHLIAHAGSNHTPKALGFVLGEALGWGALLLRAATLEMQATADERALVEAGAKAEFPIQATDLMPAFTGPALGQELARLKAKWLASDLKLDRAALLG